MIRHSKVRRRQQSGGPTMNARHLFRYARYVLTVFSCVGFGRMIN